MGDDQIVSIGIFARVLGRLGPHEPGQKKKRPAEAGRSHAEVGNVWWRNGRPARGRVFSVGRIGCNRYATNL
jgi:hypothetical protein